MPPGTGRYAERSRSAKATGAAMANNTTTRIIKNDLLIIILIIK